MAEEPIQNGERLVINKVVRGTHLTDKKWHDMERYAREIKHMNFEFCLSIEDGAPIKQQRTMADGIVFRKRYAYKEEAPTADPTVISP